MSSADGEPSGSPPLRKTLKSSANSAGSNRGRPAYNIPIKNSFDKLRVMSTQRTSSQKPSAPKPAPITITQKNIDIGEILNKIEAGYTLKRLGIGIKIYSDTAAQRETIKETLVKANIEFFSHPTNDNKTFKIILRGLPEVPTDSIVSSLKDNNNITPLKVTMFKTTSSNKLYLIEFTKGEVNKADLVQIKVVYNHIVHWEQYRKTNKGPTQCRKCGMYGHGMSHCNRSTICLFCGDKHDTLGCPLSSQNNKKANPIFKCVNCVHNQLPHNHRSDDSSCPSRKKYLELRNNRNNAGNKVPRSHGITHTAQHVNTRSQQQTYTFKSTAEAVKFGSLASNENSNELMSFAEVSQILFDRISELEKCKTRFDQLRVIASILNNVCK